MIAVTSEQGDTIIFIADQETGAIYFHALSGQGSIALKDFRCFFRSRKYRKPFGLAYRNGYLLVCDNEFPALFDLDIEAQKKALNAGDPLLEPAHVYIEKEPLQRPKSVAVSDRGIIAVGDAGVDGIVWYDPNTTPKALARSYNIDDPSGLAFRGSRLLVHDHDFGNHYSISGVVSAQSPPDEAEPVALPGELVGQSASLVREFAFYRGIYYLANGQGVYVFVQNKDRGSDESYLFPLQTGAEPSAAQVAVNEQYLLVADSRQVAILPRPVPAHVKFEADANTNRALIQLYLYLDEKAALQFKEQTATGADTNLEEWLINRNILVSGLDRGDASRPMLQNLICKYNAGFCQRHTSPDLVFGAPIVRGQTLKLPDLNITQEPTLASTRVSLNGQTLSQYLKQSVPAAALETYEKRAFDLNSSLFGTVEREMRERDYITAAGPRKSLSPGAIIKFENGQEVSVDVVRECGVAIDSLPGRALPLSKHIFSKSVEEHLPRDKGGPASRADLESLDIVEIEYNIDEPVTESLDQAKLREALRTSKQRNCLRKTLGDKNYLVVDAIKVTGGRYRLLRKDNSLVSLTEEQIKKLGLLGQPDPEGRWSIIIKEPYYIGYRVVSWDASLRLADTALRPVTNPYKVKPGSAQDILGLKVDSLLLPATQQRLTAILSNSELLENESSGLAKLKKAFPSIKVYPLQEATTRGACCGLSGGAASREGSAASLDDVARNRELLFKEIDFPDLSQDADLSQGLAEVKIAIVENPDSVDNGHADFFDGDHSIWLAPPTEKRTTGIVVKPAKEFIKEDDHGTHIAGLLAASGKARARGLVPSTKLFVVPSNTNASVEPGLQTAIASHRIFIFNFSTYVSPEGASDLKRNIKETWTDRLFIVAAGNENADLSYSEQKAPVGWASEISDNMIGVGASVSAAGVQYLLQDYRGPLDDVRTGSNYGLTHVQIVAPGYGIYSTTSKNTYAEATGTSQAVPQVTAAAAILFARQIREPSRIKARLIYTTDWFEQFQGKAWGGLLNVKRATWMLRRNTITMQGVSPRIKAIVLPDDRPGAPPATLKVKQGIHYNPVSDWRKGRFTSTVEIPFNDILRITLQSDGNFRVIYLDKDNILRIIINAELIGDTLPCKALDEWDGKAFNPSSCNSMPNGINVLEIKDYVARIPESVVFP
jgi:hypothetical protein